VTSQTPIVCNVYKGNKKADTYIYVDKREGISRVPPELLGIMGELELALTFVLTPGRTLAREDPAAVVTNLKIQGYHLQLPPVDELAPYPDKRG
tara:strand:- start:516 stop:797 length:282 start_codon:yes stop_codon:yes gene_type:complete